MIISSDKHQTKLTIQAQKPYLDYLIDPTFQEINALFILSIGNNGDRTAYIFFQN